MAEKKYTDYEQKTLRVLKMQEGDLERLQQQTANATQRLSQMDQRLKDLKERAKILAADTLGADYSEPSPNTQHPTPNTQISLDDIPSWQSLEKRADHEHIPHNIVMEDLLTGKEITYALDEVKRINDDFARRTGLTKRDLTFLSAATSIQTARWFMMPKIARQMGKSGKVLAALSPSAVALLEQKPVTKNLALIDEANQEFIEEVEAEEIKEDGNREAKARSWQDILEQKDNMPENAFNNDAMNWIFGIVNKITGTKTGSNFASVDALTGEKVKTHKVLAEAMRSIKEDPMRLTAAVYAQYAQDRAAHGETTDLLAPAMEALQPGMMSDLYQSQIQQLATMQNLTLIGQQAAFPLVVNMAVGLLHGFMYDPAIDGPREYYDARTRKILMLSNLMASGTNMAFSAATEAWMKLDLGGLLVTGTRAIQDVAYLTNLEDHFLKTKMDKVLEKELRDIDSHFNNTPAVRAERFPLSEK
jgi:hypothetical protein